MRFSDYADARLALEHRLVQTYEEEMQETAKLGKEHATICAALRENFADTRKVHTRAEELRRSIKKSIAHLEAEWRRQEGGNDGY